MKVSLINRNQQSVIMIFLSSIRNHKIFARITLLVIFLLCSFSAKSQTKYSANSVIISGSTNLDYTKLRQYGITFNIYLQGPQKNDSLGTLHDRLKILEGEGQVERTQVMNLMNQPEHVDSVRAKNHSLEPIFHYSRNKTRKIELHYENGDVTGKYTPSSGDVIAIEDSFNLRPFDSNWLDIILQLLSLVENYHISVLTHEVNANGQSGLVSYEIEVVGQTQITDSQENMFDVWKVLTQKEDQETTFYIEKKSKEVIKIVSPVSSEQAMILERTYRQ